MKIQTHTKFGYASFKEWLAFERSVHQDELQNKTNYHLATNYWNLVNICILNINQGSLMLICDHISKVRSPESWCCDQFWSKQFLHQKLIHTVQCPRPVQIQIMMIKYRYKYTHHHASRETRAKRNYELDPQNICQ